MVATRKQKKRRNVLYALVTAGIVSGSLVVIFLLYYKSAVPAYTGPVERISTGNVGEYSSLSIIAQQQGYFKKYGLEVTMKEYVSGPPAVADLIAGKIDTATAADFVGVSNSFNNENIRILATQLRAASFFMTARRDHGINTPANLKGKKIGVTEKTAGEFYMGEFLILNDLQLSDVHVVYDTPDGLVNRLVKGQVDAIVSFDPHIYDVQKQLGSNALVWSTQGDEKLSSLFYGNTTLIRDHPKAVERYLRALVDAETFTEEHNQEAKNIVGHYLGYSNAYMERIWPRLEFDVSLDQDLIISMEDQARWAIENKVVNATEVPDYLNFIYFNGLEAVKPDGITIIR